MTEKYETPAVAAFVENTTALHYRGCANAYRVLLHQIL